MADWKKFEVYDNNKRTGIINFNEKLMRKILSVSIASILTVTTITGCYIKRNGVKNNQNKIIVDTSNIDNDILNKQYFVDSVLEELYNLGNEDLRNELLKIYKTIRKLEDELDSNNEYFYFLTEDEIYSKKTEMITSLDKIINIVHQKTDYKFGVDFVISSFKKK